MSETRNAHVEITDDRVRLSADSDARIRVVSPDARPVDAEQTHARLHVSGDEWEVTLPLDAENLERLTTTLAETMHEQVNGHV